MMAALIFSIRYSAVMPRSCSSICLLYTSFQKGKRETEFERLQRSQLEKARNAQQNVMIPDEITVGELAARLKQQAGKVIACLLYTSLIALADLLGLGDADLGVLIVPVLIGDNVLDRKSTRLNSSHIQKSRMPSSA